MPALDEARDCLLNVDAEGRPIPSARFMGGREMELLAPVYPQGVEDSQSGWLAALPQVLAARAMVLPSHVSGVGPFSRHRGRWLNKPSEATAQRAAVELYAAMVANAALELIGARERILVEGRFAQAPVFVRALAALRPNDAVHTAAVAADVAMDASFGAMRLLNATAEPATPLRRVDPLAPILDQYDLAQYHAAWKAEL